MEKKKPLYTPEDWNSLRYAEDLGAPGKIPFTRGVHETMYKGRLWTMRQYAGFGTAKETNRRFHYLLEKGQTGLSVAFDLPTQMGYDSDHPMSKGEVGKVGVAIDSLLDMEELLDGIPLGKVSTSMTINATAPILLALYISIAESQGLSEKGLRGTIQNDILKEYMARGTYIYPPEASIRLATDIMEYCYRKLPDWNTISVSGYHIREAGSTAAQELAFTLANGLVYLEYAAARNLPLATIASRVSFFFNVHSNLLEEIAKFRAARRLWARLLKEQFKIEDERALKLRFHAQTAGSTLTAAQFDNNVVRVALQALSAVLGGAQSIHTNSKDEALGLPTEKAAALALRTQQIIAHESGVADIVDPLGGSFAIESLTNALEEEVRAYLEEIQKRGGVLRALEDHYFQDQIAEASYHSQLELEKKEKTVVGVNAFIEAKEEEAEIFIPSSKKVETEQLKKLKSLKKKRNGASVTQALSVLKKAAEDPRQNLLPLIIEAVKSQATLGEISDTLRAVFGTYQENISV